MFIPPFYPDELFYSVICRYAIRTCQSSYKLLMKDLFGSINVLVNYDLPTKLDYFVKYLDNNIDITVDNIIINNTLYPYYATFSGLEKKTALIEMMEGRNNNGSVRSKAGITASNIKAPYYFRFCPKCFDDDMLKYGESFWHRIHQTPGVYVCPYHGEFLINSTAQLHSSINKGIIYPNKNNCKELPSLSKLTTYEYEKLLKISKAVEWINNNYSAIKGRFDCLEGLSKRYLDFMKSRYPFADKKRIVTLAINDYKNYYGENIFKLISNNPVDEDQYYWVKMIRTTCNSIHPIRHIMLILFLADNIQEFFGLSKPNTPFGNGPWKCFNKICEHYGEDVVLDVQINRYRNRGRTWIVGLFKCDTCGYEYSRSATADGTISKPLLRHIGAKMEDKIKSSILGDIKIDSNLAYLLGIDYYILKNAERRIKLQGQGVLIKTSNYSEPQRKNYRDQWIGLVKSNPLLTKSEVRRLNNRIYKWLFKYDREWLDNNSPQIQNYKYSIKDYKEKDFYMKDTIEKELSKMKNDKDRPVRITKSLLAKRSGFSCIERSNLCSFPNTEYLITKSIESNEDFYLRKINWAVYKIKCDYGQIIPWRINKLLNIKKKYLSQRIIEYMLGLGIEN